MRYDETRVPIVFNRARALSTETMQAWSEIIRAQFAGLPVRRGLDVGCGAGRFFPAIRAALPDTELVGLDASREMLLQSDRLQRRTAVVRGSACALPVATSTIDAAFLSMVLHHISQPVSALEEVRRVLNPEGRVLIRTATKESLPSIEFFKFFPGAFEIEFARMPSRRDLHTLVQKAGLTTVRLITVTQEFVRTYEEYADRIAMRGLSVLFAISDSAFDEGLSNFRKHAALASAAGRVPPPERVDLLVARPQDRQSRVHPRDTPRREHVADSASDAGDAP